MLIFSASLVAEKINTVKFLSLSRARYAQRERSDSPSPDFWSALIRAGAASDGYLIRKLGRVRLSQAHV
jgi:hypothetical protein